MLDSKRMAQLNDLPFFPAVVVKVFQIKFEIFLLTDQEKYDVITEEDILQIVQEYALSYQEFEQLKHTLLPLL